MACLLNSALLEDENPALGRRIGDYEITGEIARGGMGIVYRATQISLKRPVALKMILGGELASPEAVQRFLIEAEATAKLRHPHIVPVYDVGEFDHEHYLVMELVEGRSLKEVVNRDAHQAALMIAKIARALAFAHEHGVLHRDLKPSNILLDEHGEPRLMDFGLAKLASQEQTVTQSRATLGSPGYMSPEQASQGVVTTSSDIYGLGAVLYDLLAGHPPFVGPTVIDTMRRVVDQQAPPLPPSVPRDLATICYKCLEKQPEARYRSALELAEDCERFVRGDNIEARPVSRMEQLTRWMKRNPRSAALSISTLLIIVGGVSGIFWQWRKAERATTEQAKMVQHLRWQRINDWLEDGDAAHALAYLGAQLRERPDSWQAAMYAMSIVDQHAFPLSAGPAIHPSVNLTKPTCIAPSGEWLAAACADKSVRLWDVVSGKELTSLQQTAPISAIATGGRTALAIATEDGALKLHQSISGEALLVARADSSPITALTFCADGTRLLARGKDHVEVHRGGTSTTLSLTGMTGAAISSSGARVLAWNKKEATVWDADSGKEMLHISASASIPNASMSGNGRRISVIVSQNEVRSWDVDTAREMPPVKRPLSGWRQLELNEKGTRVTLSGFKSELTVFDVDSGLQVSGRMNHRYSVEEFVMSRDGTRSASIGSDCTVHSWGADNGQSLMSPLWVGGPMQDSMLSLSLDGRTMLVHTKAFAEKPETLSVWLSTPVRPSVRHSVEGSSNFDICRLSPDGRFGCMGLLPNPRAYVYELATGKVVLDKPVAGGVYDFEFSPDGKRCYAFTNNGWLYGWSVPEGEELWKPSQQPGKVRPAAINANGTRLIAGHNDGHIRVYDTANGQLVMKIDHPGEIKSLRFAPDNSGRFVSSGTDRLACVWDIKTGRKLQTFAGHTHTILSTAWSPDSRLVGTASYDSTVRVWDVATGRMIGPPMNHGEWLSHLEFSPDGRRLATACRDGTARLFDPLTSTPLCEPIQQGGCLEAVRFTADGKCLFVRDLTGFRFYDAVTGDAVTQHYLDPNYIGLGMDSETVRAMVNKDGTLVFLGASMDDAGKWTIEQPRSSVPSWFPDLLETLAVMRIDHQGAAMPIAGTQIESVKQRIAQSRDDDYTRWAKHVLGMAPFTSAPSP